MQTTTPTGRRAGRAEERSRSLCRVLLRVGGGLVAVVAVAVLAMLLLTVSVLVNVAVVGSAGPVRTEAGAPHPGATPGTAVRGAVLGDTVLGGAVFGGATLGGAVLDGARCRALLGSAAGGVGSGGVGRATGYGGAGRSGPAPGRGTGRWWGPASAWQWPIGGPSAVVRAFDPPAQRWLPGHRGVDLEGPPVAVVRAAGPGVVRFAGPVAGLGVVSVDHPGGLRTTYQPVTPLVRAGQVVAAGEPVGLLDAGHDGCPAVACLHLGLRAGAEYLDPLALFGRSRVRLWPLGGPLSSAAA